MAIKMVREKGKIVRKRHTGGRGLSWWVIWSNGEKLNTYYDASPRGGYKKAQMPGILGGKVFRWISKHI